MGFICSIIVVEDITRSRKLYEQILGMKVSGDFGDAYNVGFEGGLSLYRKGFYEELINGQVNLAKNNTVSLYFEVDALEPLEKTLTDEGFEFVHPTREQPWKQRTFRVYDYDNHILEIAEKMEAVLRRLQSEGNSIEEIARLTGYTVEMVEQELVKSSVQ